MGRYSKLDIYNVQSVFRIHDLNRQLDAALEDFTVLEEYITTLSKRIEFLQKLEYTSIWAINCYKDDNHRSKYQILHVKVPTQLLTEPHYILRHYIGRLEHLKSYSYDDKDVAILCLEELIHRNNIPQEKIHVFTLNDKKLRKNLIKTIDGIFKGIPYRVQIDKSFSKAFNRESKGKRLNPEIDESGDIIHERGYETSVLSDGRPYRVEYWDESDYTFITFFFNAIDMLTFEADDFALYLAPQLILHKVPEDQWKKSGYKTIKDKEGNYLWSVTFLHSKDDYWSNLVKEMEGNSI